jgi:hypothetical protein
MYHRNPLILRISNLIVVSFTVRDTVDRLTCGIACFRSGRGRERFPGTADPAKAFMSKCGIRTVKSGASSPVKHSVGLCIATAAKITCHTALKVE